MSTTTRSPMSLFHTREISQAHDSRTIDLDPRNELLTGGESFSEVYEALLSLGPAPLLLAKDSSVTPRQPALARNITSLRVHPALEATLHLLNQDLDAVRALTKQSAPKMQEDSAEAVFFQAVAARMRGGFDTSRDCYNQVAGSEILRVAWRTLDAALEFVRDVERVVALGEERRRRGVEMEEDEAVMNEELGWRQLDEIKAVVMYSGKRFGTARQVVEEGRR